MQSLDVRHRGALDAVQDVILITDSQGALLDANKAAEDVYGYQRSEFLSLCMRDLHASESVHDFNRQFQGAFDGGITFETIHARKDGSAFPVEVRSSPYTMEESVGVISVVRDITARKEGEELRTRLLAEVSEANARLGSALALLSSVVGAADLPSLLESTVSALALVMKADAAIFVVQDRDSMRVSAEAGSSGWAPVGTRLEPGQGFCGRVAEAGVPLYVADILSSSAARPGHRSAGVHSMFGVPVYVDGGLFGVLECAWVVERPVDEAESAMIKLAADRIALAIASARLLEKSRRGERLNAVLNEVNTRLNASFEMDQALDDVLELACSALECDTALLGRAALGDWRVEHVYGLELPDDGLVFDQLVLGAMSSDAPMVFACTGSPHEVWLSSRLGLSEAVVAPVPAHRGVGGALLFGRTGTQSHFDEQSVDFVQRLAQSLALSLANAAQFEAEHHIAETLQEALLLMPRSTRGLEFSHLYRSATLTTRVGGDFFDVFEMEGGRTGVLIGDVSGKGLEAAVLTSIIKDTIRAYAHETTSPAAAIARANVALGEAAKLPDFASVFYAVIDGSLNQMSYCNAGHPPAAVVAPDCTVRLLEGTSPIIGAFPDLAYEDRSVPLDPSETVLLYTDGVTEARNRSGAFFGESGLLSSLTTACDADISKLPEEVFLAVMAFTDGRLTDDIALLAFRHTGQTSP
jgi:phosphoserine phosphatase RsbU/P